MEEMMIIMTMILAQTLVKEITLQKKTQYFQSMFNASQNLFPFFLYYSWYDFDFEKPVKWWFVYDLHVTCNLDEKELLGRVSHHVHQASVVDNKW